MTNAIHLTEICWPHRVCVRQMLVRKTSLALFESIGRHCWDSDELLLNEALHLPSHFVLGKSKDFIVNRMFSDLTLTMVQKQSSNVH